MRWFPILLLLPVLVGGCADSSVNRWPAVKPAANTLGVVYAPVAVGSLTAVYPDAAVAFANHLAWRVDFFDGRHGYDGVAAADLGSDTAAALAQLGDRDLLVIATLTDQQRIRIPGGHHRIATAELVALDRAGVRRGAARGRGEVEDVSDPKMMSPALRSESLAAKAALEDASDHLLPQLMVAQVPAAAPAPVAPAATILVTIDSKPDHADVLIDGRFVGTTPLGITLPAVEQTFRIERQGHQPWERKLTPAAEMQLSPALEPLH